MSAFRTCCRWFDLISRLVLIGATVISPFVIIGLLVFVNQVKYEEINLACGYTFLLFSIILTFCWNTVTKQYDQIVESYTELTTTPPGNSTTGGNEQSSTPTLTTPPPLVVESFVTYRDGTACIKFGKTAEPAKSQIDARPVRIPIEQDFINSESDRSAAANDAASVPTPTGEDSVNESGRSAAADVASVHEPTAGDSSSGKLANAVRNTLKTAADAAFAVSESVNAAADLAKSVNQPVDESFKKVVGVLKNIKDAATETAANVVKPICDAGASTFTNASRKTPSMVSPEDSSVPFTIPDLYRKKKISSDSGAPSGSEVSDPPSTIPTLPRVKKSFSDSGVLSSSGSLTQSSANSFDKPDQDVKNVYGASSNLN